MMPISALEKLQAWLSAYPHWNGYPARICILPKGLEEISRREDVLGNALVSCRYYVNLFWEMESTGEDTENARRLLEFQNWVQEQSVLGLAPNFGDVASEERIRTEKGGYTPAAQIITYTATLVVDFMKGYAVK